MPGQEAKTRGQGGVSKVLSLVLWHRGLEGTAVM